MNKKEREAVTKLLEAALDCAACRKAPSASLFIDSKTRTVSNAAQLVEEAADVVAKILGGGLVRKGES